MKPSIPSAERLRETLRYDESSGRLFLRVKLAHRVSVGDEAGYTIKKGHQTYRRITVDGVKFYAHQAVWLMFGRVVPSGMLIDHKDGCGTNNRIDNLRLTDKRGNAQNTKKRSDNASGVTGVSLCPTTGKWRVRVGRAWVGRFACLDEAIAARRAAALPMGYTARHGEATP